MPKNADIHIHMTAPGPPVSIAAVTPIIFPVPTVPDMAVANASNCETVFSLVSLFCFFAPSERTAGMIVVFNESPNLRTCKNPVRRESRSPVPRIRMMTGHPHTTPFIAAFNSAILSISDCHIFLFLPLGYEKV